VAAVDTIYVDPSALRAGYVHDHRSRAFCGWRAKTRGALPVTLFGRAELVNGIALAVFRKDIDKEVGRAALTDLAQDFEDGRLFLTDLLASRARARRRPEPSSHADARNQLARRLARCERPGSRLQAIRQL